MNHDHRLLDAVTWLSASVAVVSLANAAIIISIIAGLLSIALGLVRLHDRIRYGRPMP